MYFLDHLTPFLLSEEYFLIVHVYLCCTNREFKWLLLLLYEFYLYIMYDIIEVCEKLFYAGEDKKCNRIYHLYETQSVERSMKQPETNVKYYERPGVSIGSKTPRRYKLKQQM